MAELLVHNTVWPALALHFKGKSSLLFKINKSYHLIFMIEYKKNILWL